MIKKWLFTLVAFLFTLSTAFAAVEVNKADQAGLTSVKGIGSVLSKKILAERARGQFKDWSDFEKRVPGVGAKKSVKLSTAGLVVNGKTREAVAVKEAAPKKQR